MEDIAWRYVQRGDLAAAETLFRTLDNTFAGRRRHSLSQLPPLESVGRYGRLARLCRVISDPSSVPEPHRHTDIVEALLEPQFPTAAFFGPSAAIGVHGARNLHRWLILVHPDKNPHPHARQAFNRLVHMKEQLLASGDLLGACLTVTPAEPPPAPIQTALPPVRNPLREQREHHKRLAQFDTTVRKLRGPRLRLGCDLSLSAFEGAGPVPDRMASPPPADTGDSDLDSTIVLDGVLRSTLSDTLKATVQQHLRAGPAPQAPVAITSVSLRRPPTLNEWREAQRTKNDAPHKTLPSPVHLSIASSSRHL